MNSKCFETMQCAYARACQMFFVFFSSINFKFLKSNRKSIKNNVDTNVVMASRQYTCGSRKMPTILLRN